MLFDTAPLLEEQRKLDYELDVTGRMMERYTSGTAALTEADRQALSYLENRYDEAQQRLSSLKAEITDKQTRLGKIEQFIESVKQADSIYTEFSFDDFHRTVDTVTVNKNAHFTFRFFSGQELTVN